MSEIVIYQHQDGSIDVRLEKETVWLTQRQMGELFDTTPENVLMHLKKIYSDRELEEQATAKDFLVVQTEGKRQVERKLKHYNLDAIISVGYRVNSKRGVQFRIWASTVLKEYLARGYALDRHRLDNNAEELEAALKLMRKTLASPDLPLEAGTGLADIVIRYTQTFLWLQRYDEGLLTDPKGHPGGVLPDWQIAIAVIADLKRDLVAKGQASDLFGRERDTGLAAILGNLDQTVFGEPAYPTVEAKAAHLLYFIIKNHPFSDGNKRIGSLLFVDFLHRNNRLLLADGAPVINDIGLAALALLVAESKPHDKDILIRLIMTMLAGEHP